MAMLAQRTNAPVEPVEAVGLDGDMLEAQAFALSGGAGAARAADVGAGDDGGAASGVGGEDQPAKRLIPLGKRGLEGWLESGLPTF